MLWTLIKAGMFLFPFLKELFLGKDYSKGTLPADRKNTTRFAWLKKLLIAAAIVSFMSNVLLVKKTYDMAYTLLQANKEIARLQGLYRERRAPELQKTAPPVPEQPLPRPPPISDMQSKPVLPRRSIGAEKKAPHYSEQMFDENNTGSDETVFILERLKQIDKIQ